MSQARETAEERFKRLATARTNEVLRRLKILGNCANRQFYSYSSKEVDKIFGAIEKRLKETKAKFGAAHDDDFRL
jgi:hypothetical protein